MSKFGYKGGANCLCIFPKTVYLRKAVLLDDLLSRRCNLGGRSVFVSAAVVFIINLHTPIFTVACPSSAKQRVISMKLFSNR